MRIADVCIRRPVFTTMLVAARVVLGLVSYHALGVDLFPNVDFPVFTVTTTLPGASVEEMETTVTKPIEDIINTVSGIDELRSTTREGVSIVIVQFLLEKRRRGHAGGPRQGQHDPVPAPRRDRAADHRQVRRRRRRRS